MRISISGDEAFTVPLTEMFKEASISVVTFYPKYKIEVVEDRLAVNPIIDSCDCEFERLSINYISELLPKSLISLDRNGGNLDNQKVLVRIPPGFENTLEVLKGLLRAVLKLQLEKKNVFSWPPKLW